MAVDVLAGLSERSPRAWGWTDRGAVRGGRVRAFPTGVGMDRAWRATRGGASCVPHGRGDGPWATTGRPVWSARSPRAWGWTDAGGQARGVRWAFPTGVGMDRLRWGSTRAPARVPHGRGDGPIVDGDPGDRVKRSPRAWGWTGHARVRHAGPGAFPTGVGMDRSGRRWSRRSTSVPHGRGDGPYPTLTLQELVARSPRAWGWTEREGAGAILRNAFPTGVGMDRRGSRSCPGPAGVPHGRGDGPVATETRTGSQVRSPRAWGWTAGAGDHRAGAAAFPTGVGMDRPSCCRARSP